VLHFPLPQIQNTEPNQIILWRFGHLSGFVCCQYGLAMINLLSLRTSQAMSPIGLSEKLTSNHLTICRPLEFAYR